MRVTLLTLMLLMPLLISAQPLLADTYTEPTTGLEFVLIPGGSYIMGDIYGNETYAKPPHKVTLDDFYLATTEVTFAQYDMFCAETKRDKPDDKGWGRGNRPVMNVSWDDAVAYTAWLSKKTGRTMRLPSEAEWEYAAKANKSTHFFWGNEVGRNNANCRSCGSAWDKRQTAPVGSFKPGLFGLYDMHGNVYEWVLDAWNNNYKGAPGDGSAWETGDTTQRVSRGGSFNEIPNSLYSTARNWSSADEPRFDLGFRVVMEP